MLRTVALSAVVASAAAFAPAAGGMPSVRAGATATCMANKFGQSAPAGAPPADLFNIWRDDYMLTPGDAAAEEQDRQVSLHTHTITHVYISMHIYMYIYV